MLKFADAKGGEGTLTIGEPQVALVLTFTQALLRDRVGDLDGDGVVTKKDLALALENALRKADSDAAGGGPSFLQLGAAAAPQRHPWSPPPPAESLLQVLAPQVVDAESVRLTAASGMASQVSRMVTAAIQYLAGINLNRIEVCLYVAAACSMVFGIWTVLTTFRGYNRIFHAARRGDYSFQGHQDFKYCTYRPDYATYFPGIVFSTVLIGMALMFISLFLLFCLATSWNFWLGCWDFFASYIVWITITFIITQIIKIFLLDWWCVEDGEIVRPGTFACFWVMLTVVNFALGLLASVSRFALLLPFAILRFQRLDLTLLDEEFALFDAGFCSFITVVSLAYEQTNPTRISFLRALMPQQSRLYGPAEKGEAVLEKAAYQDGARRYSRPLRNRLWLGVLLSRNPSLAKYRGRKATEAAE